MCKKTLLSILISSMLVTSLTVKAAETEQISVKTTIVPFDVLDIKNNDPRYNQNAQLKFSFDETGYFPLTGMMIAQNERNPFTVINVLHGYLYAKQLSVSKNDIAIVNKLTDTNFRYDTLNTYSADLIRLVIDKMYLLGEYVTTVEMSEWLKNAPEEGRERVRSNILKLQKYFADKNKERDNSDKGLSTKLTEIYQQSRDLLSDELKQNFDVEYYLKSLLYQDEDTRQITEQMLLNSLSPQEIGEVAAVSEIIINTMVKENLPVTINKHARKGFANADTMPNIDFSGDFYRIYGAGEAFAYQLKMLDEVKIEVNKDAINQYNITLYSNGKPYTTTGKLNRSHRGLDFTLDNFVNNQAFYGEIKGDDLTIYANPEYGDQQVLNFKRRNSKDDTPRISANDFKQFELEKPYNNTPLTGKNVDLSHFNPTNIASKWLKMSDKYTVDLKELLDREKTYKTDHDYGIVLMTSQHSNTDTEVRNDATPYINRFIVVDSKSPNYKKEAIDCDELSVGAGVQEIKLNNQVKGYLSLSDYVTNDDQSFLSATVPYKTGHICLAINLGKELSYQPEKLNIGIKLLNEVIDEYSKGE